MKKPMTRSVGRLESIKTSDQKLSLPITVSFIGHLVFCLLFIYLPKVSLDRSTPTRIINVQLVAPSAPVLDAAPSVPQAAPLPAAQVEAPEPAPEAAVSTASKPKEAVSLAPKEIEKKQSMKKKTYKRERLLESAIKKVEKRVEASKADPKQEALDRIRSELEEKEARKPAEDSATATAATGMIGEGKSISDLQEIYIAEVAYNIQRNWAFSDQLAGDNENLYNEVVIKIQRNGTIGDVWFDRRSGNSHFDDSTYKAILKSSPLPPIPDGISGSSLTWGFRFKPGGLK
jgi:colicin import membrane protein